MLRENKSARRKETLRDVRSKDVRDDNAQQKERAVQQASRRVRQKEVERKSRERHLSGMREKESRLRV